MYVGMWCVSVQSVSKVCLCSQCVMSVCAVSVYCLSVQSVRLLWEQHKDSGAFQAIVAQEFDRALATLSSEIMQNEAEVTICPPSPPPPAPPSQPMTRMLHGVFQEKL